MCVYVATVARRELSTVCSLSDKIPVNSDGFLNQFSQGIDAINATAKSTSEKWRISKFNVSCYETLHMAPETPLW